LQRAFIKNFPKPLWKETLISYLDFLQFLDTPDDIACYLPLLETIPARDKLKQVQQYRHLSRLLNYFADLKLDDKNLYENLVEVALPAPIWKEAFATYINFEEWLPIWKKISSFEINSLISNLSPEIWAKLLTNERGFKEVCHLLAPQECFFLLKYLLNLTSNRNHQCSFNFKRKFNIAKRYHKITESEHTWLSQQLPSTAYSSVLLKNKKNRK
jgi:hypothetical protein